jgi:anti-sigma factor RsiW
MRCAKARRWISDYIDGHLDDKKESALQNHLEGCPDCQKVLQDLKGVVERARNLADVSPSAQAWFRIKSQVKEEMRMVETPPLERMKLKYVLSTALILLIVFALAILGWRYGKGLFPRMEPQQYTLSKLREAEHDYQLAIKALDQAVSTQEKRLHPEVARIFQAHLEIADLSIKTCQRAVFVETDNIDTRNDLLYVYNMKLKLLDKMAAIKSNSSYEGELGKTL